jgi:glycosyltransferase involved in cell wall biosynthesis
MICDSNGGRLGGRRMSWLTNQWAPYRRPVWEHLGRFIQLSVNILQPSLKDIQSENKGDDWMVEGNLIKGYKVRFPATLALNLYSFKLSFLLAPWRVVQSSDVVVLGGWESPAYWQVLLFARLKRCRTVGFYESTVLSNRYRSGLVARARRFFFKRLDAVVVPGVAAKEAVLAFGVALERVFMGFNAVDVAAAARSAERVHAALPVSHDTAYRLIYVGQLIPRKNVDSLLRALALIDDRYSLTIVGQGPEEESLVRLADALGVRPRVEFIGYVPSDVVSEILSRHSVLVLPSYEEVWGLVVNEALACGLHVVLTDVCGVARSVAGMPGVWLCNTTPASLGQAISSSTNAWRGPIAQPEILAHTPEAFAEIFLQASATREAAASWQ